MKIIIKYSFKQIMLILSAFCLFTSISLYRLYDQKLSDVELNDDLIKLEMGELYLEQWPKINNPIKLSSQQLERIESLINEMSLNQKIGQMINVHAEYDVIKREELNIGNVFLTPNIGANNRTKQSNLLDQFDTIYEYMKENAINKSMPFIPPFICATQSIGNHLDSKAVMFANSYALGAANNTDLTFKIGESVAEQFISTGINCVTNNAMVNNTSGHPAYSIHQLQVYYKGMLSKKRLLGSIDITMSDEMEFNKEQNHLKNNYIHALNEGVLSVSISDFKINDIENNTISLLKDVMGFKGVVFTGENAANNVNGCWVGRCDKLINAGVDVITFNPGVASRNDRIIEFIDNTVDSVNKGKINKSRIDDAVRRILKVKMHIGLFDGLLPSDVSDGMISYKKMVKVHEKLANEIVNESSVLIKNNKNIIPMNRKGTYLIAGDALDDISFQLDYLNNKNADKFNKLFKGYAKDATIINPMFLNEHRVVGSLMNQHYVTKMKVNRELRLSPIKMDLVVPKDEQLKLDELNEFYDTDDVYQFSGKEYDQYLEAYRDKIREYVSGFDRLIYIMNEPTQQELDGLALFLNGPPITQSNLLEVVKDVDVEIVIVYLSSKPNAIPVAMNRADAFVMAWKPGSEINGLMDLLFRDKNNEIVSDFNGRLSKTWPMRSCDFYNFYGSDAYFSQLPLNYGLSVHDQSAQWVELPDALNFCQYSR